MRILRGVLGAAVACLLFGGALQAQTAIGQAKSIWEFGGNGYFSNTGVGSAQWHFYTNPYHLQAKIPSNPSPALLPPAGTSTFGPTWDAYCVDFYNESNFSGYDAYFTNLGDVPANPTWLGTYTRSSNLQQYLAAAYLAEEMQAGHIGSAEGSGAIWLIMTNGAAPRYWWNGSSWQDLLGTASYAYYTGYGTVDPTQWVVVTGYGPNGLSVDQEYITQVTPEPATLLLLGTGLVVVLMAAGAFRKPTA